ncbi:MAG: hypothetical protein SV775_11885 [Thermodesulfobacteriota bacterium]|nr:hypothetical protein [Thermodesulfobacteriota bacterium]
MKELVLLITTTCILVMACTSNVTEASGIPCNDDLSDPGIPAVKSDYTEGLDDLQGPSDHFDYNLDDYWVRTENIHTTTVSVAIHRAALSSGPSPDEFSDYVIKCFHLAWHTFGGYKYERYGIKVRANGDTTTWSLSRVGVSITATDFAAPYLWEYIAHEIFHSWLGKLIEREPDGSGNAFQLEIWIKEGATTYYGIRHMGLARGGDHYTSGMLSRWNQYSANVGTEFDLSIDELVAAVGVSASDSPNDGEYTNMIYARSSLINYMLDMELSNDNQSLDALMGYLYEHYGLTGVMWRHENISPILESLTGRSYDDFIDTHILTNAQLPLDGNFQLLKRDEFYIDITANGSDGPVTVLKGTPVSIAISIDPGSCAGQNVDWWIYLDGSWSSQDYYSYVIPGGWRPGFMRTIAYQLMPISSKTILNTALPVGSYFFFFAVDDNADNVTDWTWLDFVQINVQ